jgi:hypothetical protein
MWLACQQKLAAELLLVWFDRVEAATGLRLFYAPVFRIKMTMKLHSTGLLMF